MIMIQVVILSYLVDWVLNLVTVQGETNVIKPFSISLSFSVQIFCWNILYQLDRD